jgi:hypothetical protein
MRNSSSLDQILDTFAACLDARRAAEFRISQTVQDRMDKLAERANEGELTDNERDEYEALVDVADMIAILKLKARRRLDTNGS